VVESFEWRRIACTSFGFTPSAMRSEARVPEIVEAQPRPRWDARASAETVVDARRDVDIAERRAFEPPRAHRKR
jgi:hypothetical protein